MKSKSLIEKQLKRKRNPELVETLILAKKNKEWLRVAEKLSTPKRKMLSMNLSEISEITKGEAVVVPGKVLSDGKLNKKMKIVALSISEMARNKLKESGSEFISIFEEIKKNPSAKGLEILTE